jgi:AAA-like domain
MTTKRDEPRPAGRLARVGVAARRIASRRLGEREASTDVGPASVVGHVVAARDGGLWAYYELADQRWSFLDLPRRERLAVAGASRWSALAPRAVKLRSSSRPYPAARWAADLDADTPRPLPDVAGAVGYDELLRRQAAGDQRVALSYAGWLVGQQSRVRTTRSGERLVTVGVRLVHGRRDLSIEDLATAVAWSGGTLPDGHLGRVTAELRRVGEIVAGPGWDGRPALPATLERAMHTALAPGAPVPGADRVRGSQLDEADLRAISDAVRWEWEPFGSWVRVTWRRGLREQTHYATVLTAGRMPDTNFPANGADPWMTLTDQLDHPVEWSVSGYVRHGRKLEESADWDRRRVENLVRDYRQMGEPAPRSLLREKAHAEQIVEEVTDGTPEVAGRFEGVIRALVWGSTPEEVGERAEGVRDHLLDAGRIEMHCPVGQTLKLAEFFPSAPWESRGYTRMLPVRYLAAGLPHVSAQIGDSAGPYLGVSAGAVPQALMLDGHKLTEGETTRSGLCPIVADQGAGKSMLTGALAYQGVRLGKQVVVLDPSGPLARLCDVPELAPHAQHLSLTAGEPGSLTPCALIPEAPSTGDPLQDAKRRRDDSRMRGELLVDTLAALIPVQSRAAAMTLLPRARRVLGEVTTRTSPWQLIESLRTMGETGRELAEVLADVAEMPEGALILGTPGEQALPPDMSRPLTVLTVDGIDAPPAEIDETGWSHMQRLAAPLLNMAVLYATRVIRQGSADIRRQIHLDELHFFSRWASGVTFFKKATLDTRKRNAVIYASTQLPEHLTPFGGQTLATFTHAFVGRLEDEQVAREALQIVRVPGEYASVLTGLSRDGGGEFLYRDGWGRVERVRIDLRWLPHVFEALRTDPGRHRTPGQAVA